MDLNRNEDAELIIKSKEFIDDYAEYFGTAVFCELFPILKSINYLIENKSFDESILQMLNELKTVFYEELLFLRSEFDEFTLQELHERLNVAIITSNKLIDYFLSEADEGYLIIIEYMDVVFGIKFEVECFIFRNEEIKEEGGEIKLYLK